MFKAYKYRLYPNKAQEKALFMQLRVLRSWWNMCLEERKLAWDIEKRNVSKSDQQKNIKYYRNMVKPARSVSSQSFTYVIMDLDEAFKAFFRRVKHGEKPGYPKFKGRDHFNSIRFTIGNGCHIRDGRLDAFGVGAIKINLDRTLGGVPKTCRVIYRAGKWYVSFPCELPDIAPLATTEKCVGIDVGLSALITDSNGVKTDNPKWYREAQAKLRILNRRLARAKRGSNNRYKKKLAVQRWHEYIKNKREDFLNKLVNDLIQEYDLIAIEDLQIANMVKNKHLSKSILDAGWGYFKKRLHEKAAETGREIIEVNPAYTSKSCSNCGSIFEGQKLSDRWVDCECGLSLDRDHNAAINILNRARHARVA